MSSEFTQSALNSRTPTRRTLLIVILCAVLLGTLGVGGWLLWPEGGSKADPQGETTAAPPKPGDVVVPVDKAPESIEGEFIRAVTSGADIPEGVIARTPGMWATEKILAKGDGKAVFGYETEYGEKKWEVKLPGEICAAARHVTVSGMTAVLAEGKPSSPGKESCSELVAFDIDTGKEIWREHLEEAEDASNFLVGLTVSQGVTAVTWSSGAAAFDLATGERKWSNRATTTCRDVGFGGGEELVAVVNCGVEERILRVEKLDPATGEAVWTYKVSPGILDVKVLSTAPVLLGMSAGDYGVTDIVALTAEGRLRSSIPMQDGRYVISCQSEMEQCRGYAADKDRLYIGTQEGEDLDQPANSVVGFDLDTGKVSGAKFDSIRMSPLVPIRMSGDRVIAYRTAGYMGTLVSLDPATGEQAILMIHPIAEYYGLMDPLGKDIVYAYGRLFFGARQMEGLPSEKGKKAAPTAALIFAPLP